MKKLLLFSLGFTGLVLSGCQKCAVCSGVEICVDSGATFTDNLGNPISWEEYKAANNCTE